MDFGYSNSFKDVAKITKIHDLYIPRGLDVEETVYIDFETGLIDKNRGNFKYITRPNQMKIDSPFNRLFIQNNSKCEIQVYVGSEFHVHLWPYSNYEQCFTPAFTNITVQNIGDEPTDRHIDIHVQRKATIEDLLIAIYNRVPIESMLG